MSTYAEEFGDLVKAHQTYRLADGTIVPSVTAILRQVASPELVNWAASVTREGLSHRAIAEESARVGTLAHDMVRCRLLGVEPDLSHHSPNQVRLAENAMRKFLEYSKWHSLEPELLEAPLVSEAHRYGGTLDFYGLCDGKPTLLDWKTGSGVYERHKQQAAAYWSLLVENGHPVESVRILRIGREEQGGYQEHRVGRLEKRFGAFLDLLAYHEKMRGMEG
jgi:hypothetical protein